jgi:hypothetical protein
MNIDLEQLKQAAQVADQGVWSIGQSAVETNSGWIVCERPDGAGGSDDHEQNKRFVALSRPEVVLGLIERLERAELYAANWLSLSLPGSEIRLVHAGLNGPVDRAILAHVNEQGGRHGRWTPDVDALLDKLVRHVTHTAPPTVAQQGALTVPIELLTDLVDDVSDYAASRTFREQETVWRRDLVERARALLAAGRTG